MPLVRIEIENGFSAEYRKALMNGVHSALVEALKIPEHDRRQRLYELEPDRFDHTGRSRQFTLVEITMFAGRSTAAKKGLYSLICRNLEMAPGIPGEEIIIVLNEPPLENWGIRGGKPASEVGLGFEVNV